MLCIINNTWSSKSISFDQLWCKPSKWDQHNQGPTRIALVAPAHRKTPTRVYFSFWNFYSYFYVYHFQSNDANLFNTRNLRPGLISVGRFLLKSMFLFRFSLFAFCHNFLHSDVTFPKAYLTLNDIANVHHCSGAHLHKYFYSYFLYIFYHVSIIFLMYFCYISKNILRPYIEWRRCTFTQRKISTLFPRKKCPFVGFCC